VLTILELDSFTIGLKTILNRLDYAVDYPYLLGRTGHGARFSLAMNTKTGKEIGHPSGHYSWDVIAVLEHCFPSAGIDATLYIGPGYATRARKTAAQSSRQLPVNVIELSSYDLDRKINGNLLYADESGQWQIANSTDAIEVDWSKLPFGPVIFNIQGMMRQSGFPAGTMRYLVDTIERGEEPMEIRGRNNYSTVSGWKAYARWMQSFAVPLPDVQHEHLQSYPDLLYERRLGFVRFLEQLKDECEAEQIELIVGLLQRYRPVVSLLDELRQSNPTMEQIRSVYFAEQKTQTYYKKIDTYLTHHYSPSQ